LIDPNQFIHPGANTAGSNRRRTFKEKISGFFENLTRTTQANGEIEKLKINDSNVLKNSLNQNQAQSSYQSFGPVNENVVTKSEKTKKRNKKNPINNSKVNSQLDINEEKHVDYSDWYYGVIKPAENK
jgi:hypothetical protein